MRKPMVQTDNSQSHRFSLSKYRGADDAAVKKLRRVGFLLITIWWLWMNCHLLRITSQKGLRL